MKLKRSVSRETAALITRADIAQMLALVQQIKQPCKYLQADGTLKAVAPTIARALFAGQMDFVWNRRLLAFARNGRVVAPEIVKAAANGAVTVSRTAIQQRTLELAQMAQRNKGFSAADVLAWEADAKAALKALNGANAALARGGFDQMSVANWQAASVRVARQYAAVERVADRIARSGYGTEISNGQLLTHAQNLANSGRATYEGTRLDNASDLLGHDEFKRLLGANDHCESAIGFTGCIEAAEMGWVSRDEFIEIGDCTCHGSCNCTAISRRSGQNQRLGI